MASAAVLWFGEQMSAVPLRNNKAAASDVRSVTVLGATGSIGDSTMDLLRASPERYRVEALTANGNVAALAKLAKEFSARFVAIADSSKLGNRAFARVCGIDKIDTVITDAAADTAAAAALADKGIELITA